MGEAEGLQGAAPAPVGGAVRIERDPLGEVAVPADAYWGPQTARALQNFRVSGCRPHPAFVRAMIHIKRAAALANMETGRLPADIGRAIVQAAEEALAQIPPTPLAEPPGGAPPGVPDLSGQWVVDPYQAGAGTSHNMNTNEVLANRAIEILGGRRGDYRRVHPNDHVNMAQSTNDTVPTAIRLIALDLGTRLLRTLTRCADAFHDRALRFDHILKTGRTHLQDAVPIRLGQEFAAYARTVERGARRIAQAMEPLREIGLGGTAVGTGLNAEPAYITAVARHLGAAVGQPLRPAADLVQAMQSMGDIVAFSGACRTLAMDLNKIANDLRLLASGPRTGLGEIILPAVQPGSSIMPGKVNPVLCEMLNMVCYQVLGLDLTITAAGEAGQLELNVMMPVIAHNLAWMLTILDGGVACFTERCVVGIEADAERCRYWLERSAAMSTALAPTIGYEAAAALTKEMLATGKGIAELALEKGLLTREQLEAILDPEAMTSPGVPGR
jgi:aspartate ammonia-lyase